MSSTQPRSRFGQFLAEMRRRRVGRFVFGYAAAAFVVLQLAEIVFPAFGIGEGGLRFLVVATGLGFPPALVLAWMYDLTSEGIRRTDGIVSGPFLPRLALGGLLVVTILMMGSLGVYLARQGVFESPTVDFAPLQPEVQLATYDPDAPIRSIAVLPLADYSPNGDQAYFTASMHEELIAKLSSLEHVRVVSRTSVTQFAGTTLSMPEIARRLDVDVIIEGSVARSAERIRVTLQLIHAPSDTHIETLQWDRANVDDVLSFQTEIAHEVVTEVSTQYEAPVFVQSASNVVPEAQDAYIRGRYEYERGTPEGLRAAADHFEDALELDPDFAQAMAGIAGARFLIELEGDDVSPTNIASAHAVALEALRLDSTSMEVREVVALIERSLPRIGGSAALIPAPPSPESQLRIFTMNDGRDSIIVGVPAFDSAWVSAQTSLGERIQESLRQRSIPRNLSDADRTFFEARQLAFEGRHAEAARTLELLVAEDPDHRPAWDLLARSHMAMGEPNDALETVRAWAESGGRGAPTLEDFDKLAADMRADGPAGYWTWRIARLESLVAAGEHVPHMAFASSYAALDSADAAIEHLVAAVEAGESGVFGIRSDPVWDELRSDPRVQEIARQARRIRVSPIGPPPRAR